MMKALGWNLNVCDIKNGLCWCCAPYRRNALRLYNAPGLAKNRMLVRFHVMEF